MYTFESRVRFSEADHTELLTLPGLVNYFQDCRVLLDVRILEMARHH